jgi:AraC-like DNA-binding protein
MDRFTALLDGPRARGAFVLRSLLRPPWSMQIRDEAPLSIAVVVRGEAWITGAGEVRLPAGTAALIRGPEHYTVSDAPDTAPRIVIHPGQRCESLDGAPLALSMRLGVRTWGDDLHAPTVLITGTYEQHGALAADLLAALPPVVAVPRPDDDPLVELLAAEIGSDLPGQQALLDRLLDALVIDTLRRWHTERSTERTGWWHAHQDPIVGAALRLIHDGPDQPWTVAALARAVGVSRAGLAARFTDLVGEPPITYLTRWRLGLAADLLSAPASTVAGVAAAVGYSSPFALSTAFKRRYGVSPHEHRIAARSAEAQPHPTAQVG